ncbi:MAG: hypothetical protein J5671_01135 [Bacteroidaceae bacterium]|nr:hypothetical protein [Bacteroidaceae bacterium]
MEKKVFIEESTPKEKKELTPMEKLQESKSNLMLISISCGIFVGLSSLIVYNAGCKESEVGIFIIFNIITTVILSLVWYFHLCKYIDIYVPLNVNSDPRSNAINIITKAIMLLIFIGVTLFICKKWHESGESVKKEIVSNRSYRYYRY